MISPAGRIQTLLDMVRAGLLNEKEAAFILCEYDMTYEEFLKLQKTNLYKLIHEKSEDTILSE